MRASDDHALGERERCAFALAKRPRALRVEACFETERMMTERDERRADAAERRRGQGAKGEPVDHNHVALPKLARDRREACFEIGVAWRSGKLAGKRQ